MALIASANVVITPASGPDRVRERSDHARDRLDACASVMITPAAVLATRASV